MIHYVNPLLHIVSNLTQNKPSSREFKSLFVLLFVCITYNFYLIFANHVLLKLQLLLEIDCAANVFDVKGCKQVFIIYIHSTL